MTDVLPRLKRLVRMLGFQIAFLLAVSLLPLSIISILIATNAAREVKARSEDALSGVTMTAISNEVALIDRAQGIAIALSHVVDGAGCGDLLKSVAMDNPDYSHVSYIGVAGDLRCTSAPVTYDPTTDATLMTAVTANIPTVTVNEIAGDSTLLIAQPVRDASSALIGIIAITLPHSSLKSSTDSSGFQILTFDRSGQILTASGGVETATQHLPRGQDLQNLHPGGKMAFFDFNNAGVPRVFSVVPIIDGALYALGSWPEAATPDPRTTFLTAPFLAPLVMWIASLVVAWLGVERLVLRNIRKLGASIRSFASGSRSVGDIDMRGAPVEISEMAAAYRQMTDSIIQDEAALEDTVHQKEVLLREVHHRVKNNLQLIASIMNMHIRKAQNAETRAVIRKLQDRVMSLATIHRELYQTVGLTDVHAAELLSSITTQVVKMAALPDRAVAVSKSFDDVILTPDQAVPLALLLAEGLGNALKYEENGPQPPSAIEVSLSAVQSGQAVLMVSHKTRVSSADNEVEPEADPLSAQLLTAFAAQIGGQVRQDIQGETSQLVLEFVLRPLSDAEERNASPSAT